MAEDLNYRLAEVREKFDFREQLRGALGETREALQQETGQLDMLGLCMKMMDSEVRKLESFNLATLFYTLSGSIGEKLNNRREEHKVAVRQYKDCTSAITAMEQNLADIEQQLAEFGDLDALFDRLIEAEEKSAVQSDPRLAQRFEDLSQEIAEAESRVRGVRKAIDLGDNVLVERQTAKIVTQQVTSKASYANPILIRAAINSLNEHRAASATKPVHKALQRFRDALNQADLGRGTNEDAALINLIAEVEVICGGSEKNLYDDHGANLDRLSEVELLVGEIIDHLQERLAGFEKNVEALKEEKQDLLEMA